VTVRRDLTDLRDALRLATHIVSDDPAQLAGQLLARLAPDRSPGVARLLAGAGSGRDVAWLRPLMPSLINVGGPLRMTIAAHTGWVGATAISSDGRIAVSGGDDATVRAWDLELGTELHVLSGHTGPIRSVAVSADGRLAVSGGDDATVRVWDLAAGRERHRLEGHDGPVQTVDLTADGGIAVSGGDDGHLRLWDIARSGGVQVLPGHEGRVRAVAITPDGRSAVSGGDDKHCRVWDLALGEVRQTAYAYGVRCVAIDDPGTTVVWGTRDGGVAVWAVAGEAKPLVRSDHGGLVRAIAMTPDGATMVSASDDHTVRVWESTGEAEPQVLGHLGIATGAVAVDAAGRVAVSGSGDGRLTVWNLDRVDAPDSPVTLMQHDPDFGLCDLAIVSDGHMAVSRGGDGIIRKWDLARLVESGVLRDRRTFVSGRPGPVLALLPDRAIDASFDRERRIQVLRVWDLASGALLGKIDGPDPRINCLAATSDGNVVAGLNDGWLAVFDITGSTCTTVDSPHRSSVDDIAVSPDGHRVLSASSDGSVGVWNAGDWSLDRTLGSRAGPGVTAIAPAPDSRHAVAGHQDGTVVLWDLDEGAAVLRAAMHRDEVTSVSVLPDGHTLVSTSRDHSVRATQLWHADRPSAAFTADSPMLRAAVTPDGAAILAGERSGRIHVLQLVGPVSG